MALRVVALDDYQGLVEQYGLDGRPDARGGPPSASTRPAAIWPRR